MQIALEPAAILSPECQNWQRFLNQTSTTTCILKQLFLRYNHQLQMSKCRIVFLLSFVVFSFLSRLPPWKNRVAGLPVSTGCNYGQQCRGAINLYGSMHNTQECKLKVGRLMKWDLPFWFSRRLHHTFHVCEGMGSTNSSFQLVSLSLVLVLLHLCP